MIDPNVLEIMNLELDGRATESQRAELHRYLESNPEARDYFESLGGLVRQLNAHPEVEPPAELHHRVVAAVDAAMTATPHRTPARRWRSPFRMRGLAPFLFGVVTGVFLLAAIQFDRSGAFDFAKGFNPSEVGGTMAPPAGIRPVGSIDIPADEAGVSGKVDLLAGGSQAVAEVSFDSDTPVSWIIDHDPGLAVTRVETGKGGTFSVVPGEVQAVHPGHGQQEIVFSGRAKSIQSIVLKVVKDGHVVFERSAVPSH